MALQLFNTLSRAVEEFVPLDPVGQKVGMYCCGPTVYDFAHIGNWRTFVFNDLVRRFLEFKGYTVNHVMNITDVEDKIIRRFDLLKETPTLMPPGMDSSTVYVADELVPISKAKTLTLQDYTQPYERAFLKDLQVLGCVRPHQMPRATDHIREMISLIEKLLARGIAYKAPDGSVYFSIEKYRAAGHRYGQLLNLNLDELRIGERVQSDEYEKESVADFALWKARAPEDGDVFWPSPWGEGRPGWHIECSAMSMKYLGASFDIHLGGEDLIFPHHEDEIAQSEGAELQLPGQRFVKHWLHGAHLMVEGKKMSKSLGNFYTLRDLLGKGFTGREIRYLLLTARYREPLNFTMDGLQGARAALERIDECLMKLRELTPSGVQSAGGGAPKPSQGETSNLVAEFTAALDDDLNISGAWGAIFEWVRDTNRRLAENSLDAAAAVAALTAWEKVDSVLGVGAPRETEVPAEINGLLEARQAARKAKDFKRADAIRDELKAKGWIIEDTPKGARVKRI